MVVVVVVGVVVVVVIVVVVVGVGVGVVVVAVVAAAAAVVVVVVIVGGVIGVGGPRCISGTRVFRMGRPANAVPARTVEDGSVTVGGGRSFSFLRQTFRLKLASAPWGMAEGCRTTNAACVANLGFMGGAKNSNQNSSQPWTNRANLGVMGQVE